MWSFGYPVPASSHGYERGYAPRKIVRSRKGRDCLHRNSVHLRLTQEKEPNLGEVSHTVTPSTYRCRETETGALPGTSLDSLQGE